jgi:hypothetical protein
MNMGYALILGIKKNRKNITYMLRILGIHFLVGSIQLIIYELILVKNLVPFLCHLCKKIDCANTLASFLKSK